MKKFVIKGGVFFCAAILSQAAANPDELTTVHSSNDLSRKILFPVVEEMKNWLAGLPEMSEEANYVTENLERYDESLIEVEELRTKAKEYKAAGDEIQADLYEAKAVQAVVSAQGGLTDVINIPNGLILGYARRVKGEGISEQEKKIQEQAEKHLELLVFKRNFDLGIAQCEAKTLLYKAEAAQYTAAGQLDVAEKYKETAKRMIEAAELLAEGKKYKIAGDEIQANSYRAEALSLYFNILRNVKREETQITVTSLPDGTIPAQKGDQSRGQDKKALEPEETANGECKDSLR